MEANSPPLKGIIPIPVTTFDDVGNLDTGGLRSQAEFCLDAGVDGIAYPGVVSEFYTLTDSERQEAIQAVAGVVAGRIPFVIGVSAISTRVAAEFSRHARDAGADGIMAMAPFVQHFFPHPYADIRQHFSAISEASGLPIVLQNARIGHSVAIKNLPSLISDVPAIHYVKQETNPPTQHLSEVIEVTGGTLRGVFGGLGGVYLLNELERGAAGSMPAPQLVDVLVEVYRAYSSGKTDAAYDLIAPLGSLFTRELLYNVAIIKAMLLQRGIIGSTTVRIGSPELDDVDLTDVSRLLSKAGIIADIVRSVDT